MPERVERPNARPSSHEAFEMVLDARTESNSRNALRFANYQIEKEDRRGPRRCCRVPQYSAASGLSESTVIEDALCKQIKWLRSAGCRSRARSPLAEREGPARRAEGAWRDALSLHPRNREQPRERYASVTRISTRWREETSARSSPRRSSPPRAPRCRGPAPRRGPRRASARTS